MHVEETGEAQLVLDFPRAGNPEKGMWVCVQVRQESLNLNFDSAKKNGPSSPFRFPRLFKDVPILAAFKEQNEND